MKNFALLWICLILAIPCQARTITVDDDGPADFNTIQAAINNSNNGDIIIVSPGTYTGPGNRDINFLGKAITLRSTDPNDPNVVAATIIDCNGTESEPHRGFYFDNYEDANSVLAGLTITNGYANQGGGIFCEQSSPTITNCDITGNSAGDEFGMGFAGGGIFCKEAVPTITNCVISKNYARHGGGVAGCDGPISGCIITDNWHSGLSNCNGPITDCAITTNSAGRDGGGLKQCNSEITDCNISNNTAEHMGGGLSHCNGTISNCIITGNSVIVEGSGILGSQGGGLFQCNGVISNCIISGNSAGGDGGGLGSCGGSINSCIINGNSAQYDGGGLSYCDALITNCTIYGNSADKRGGGIFNCSRPISNCIMWDDMAKLGNEIAIIWYLGCLTTEVVYSDVRGGTAQIYVDPGSTLNWGAGNIDVGPEFADPESGDFHLQPGSFCIDAGTNDPNGGLATTDIEGNPRLVDSDSDGQAVVDMGAYESLPANEPVIILSAYKVEFETYEGGENPQNQKLYIHNGGTGTINWTIAYDCNWLEATPTTGSSSGDVNEVCLSTDMSDFPPGMYECDLTISASSAINTPRTLKVVLDVFGETVYVPSQFYTIQNAIDHVLERGLVIVSDGIYQGPGNRDIDFKGKAITVQSENGPDNCIIDCHGTEASPHRGFYSHSDDDANSVLDGFTITNGYRFELLSDGVVLCIGASLTIKNCIISGNSVFLGSAISGTPFLTNCIISGNSCVGVMHNDRPITNCVIAGNSGGGLYMCSGSLNNCIIVLNLTDFFKRFQRIHEQ